MQMSQQAVPRPALLFRSVIFEDLDADVVRPFDESKFEFAAEERPRLVRYLDAIFLQPVQRLVKILNAESKVIDGMTAARFQAGAAFPGVLECRLGVADRINDDADIVHHQAYGRSGLAPATISRFARGRIRAAAPQPELLHVPLRGGDGVLAQQMNVIEISNVGRRGVEFNQGVIRPVDVGKEETSISPLAIALVADIGDRRLELGAARNLFLIGLFHVFTAAPTHVPDGRCDLGRGRRIHLCEQQPGVVRPHAVHHVCEFALLGFELGGIEADRRRRIGSVQMQMMKMGQRMSRRLSHWLMGLTRERGTCARQRQHHTRNRKAKVREMHAWHSTLPSRLRSWHPSSVPLSGTRDPGAPGLMYRSTYPWLGIRQPGSPSSTGSGLMGWEESCVGKHLVWGAELCRLPQFDGISLRVMKTSEATNVGIRFRVFDLNSCRS